MNHKYSVRLFIFNIRFAFSYYVATELDSYDEFKKSLFGKSIIVLRVFNMTAHYDNASQLITTVNAISAQSRILMHQSSPTAG